MTPHEKDTRDFAIGLAIAVVIFAAGILWMYGVSVLGTV